MKIFLLSIIVLLSTQVYSQNINFQPYNLDFEIGTPPSVPYIWELTKKSADFDYNVVSTSDSVFSGKRAASFFNFTPKKAGMYGTFYQKFSASRYKNKKVYLSANIYTKLEGDSANIRLFIHEFDKNGKSIKIEQMIDNPIFSSNWDSHKIELDISNDANTISIGFVMMGRGICFIDNVKFDIIPEINYSPISSLSLNENSINNIFLFTKAYSYLRYNLPTSEIVTLKSENFIRNSLQKIINENDVIAGLNKVFNPVFPVATISAKPINSTNTQKDAIPNVGVLYKTRVAFNDANPGISSTEVKNIYIPDKDKQGFMLKYVDVKGLGGKDFVFSCNAKTKLLNLYSNAQLWIRIQREAGEDINVYMFENAIKNKDWEKVENKVKLPDNATKVTIGCVLIGDGEAWFDDLKVEIKDEVNTLEVKEISEDFESQTAFTEPKNWKIPNSVKYAGYDFSIDNTEAKSGKQSLKISTSNSFVIHYPDITNFLNYKISDNIYLNMPRGVYLGENGTLPYSDSLNFEKLKSEINSNDLSIEDVYSQLAVLIDLYSYINNYYLFDNNFNQNDFDNNFKIAVKEISTGNIDNFDNTIRKFLATLNDPQIRLWKLGDENLKSLPFTFDRYSDGFRVSQIYKQVEGLNVGDKILKIENIDVDKYVINELKYINGAANVKSKNNINSYSDYLISRAIARITMGGVNNELLFDFEGKKINFKKDVWNSEYIKSDVIDMMKPDSNIMYINMAMFDDKFFKFLAKELNKYDGLIFDARGNSLLSEHFLGYFLQNRAKTNLTKVPYFVEAGKENVQYEQIQPFLGKFDTSLTKNVVFLIDENTIGYSEFIMNLVSYYGIGTIIGRESVGMPSDVVSIALPLDYNFCFSAFGVNNPMGKSIMYKPIKPEIEVENVYDKDGKDLIYEKAVEFLRDKLKNK